MKQTTKSAIKAFTCLAFAIIIAFFTGCGTPASTREDAVADFKDEVSIVSYENHDYLVWVHGAYKMNQYTYVSGITHSASCKNPEHKQTMVSELPTPSPTPKKP